MISDIFCAEILIVGVFLEIVRILNENVTLFKVSVLHSIPSNKNVAKNKAKKLLIKLWSRATDRQRFIFTDLSQLLALFIFVDYDYNQIR